MGSASETSPPALSLPFQNDETVTATKPRNVYTLPHTSRRQDSNILALLPLYHLVLVSLLILNHLQLIDNLSQKSIISRTQSKLSVFQNPLIYIPQPATVGRFGNYSSHEPRIVNKTSRGQLDIYRKLTSLFITTSPELRASFISQFYPPLKHIRQPSTSLTNFSYTSSQDYKPSQVSISTTFLPH